MHWTEFGGRCVSCVLKWRLLISLLQLLEYQAVHKPEYWQDALPWFGHWFFFELFSEGGTLFNLYNGPVLLKYILLMQGSRSGCFQSFIFLLLFSLGRALNWQNQGKKALFHRNDQQASYRIIYSFVKEPDSLLLCAVTGVQRDGEMRM